MPYRYKESEPYAEFIVREKGVADWPLLTIEVESSYSPQFVDELKAVLSHGTQRAWVPDLKRWYVSPAVLDAAVEVAKHWFRNVYLTEGENITELNSGRTYSAPKLF
jgi:hypothetical protein